MSETKDLKPLKHRVIDELSKLYGTDGRQSAQAKIGGVSPSYMSQIKKHQRNLTLDTLERMVSGMGYDVHITFRPKRG